MIYWKQVLTLSHRTLEQQVMSALTFDRLSWGHKVGKIMEEQTININKGPGLCVWLHTAKHSFRRMSTLKQLKKDHIVTYTGTATLDKVL